MRRSTRPSATLWDTSVSFDTPAWGSQGWDGRQRRTDRNGCATWDAPAAVAREVLRLEGLRELRRYVNGIDVGKFAGYGAVNPGARPMVRSSSACASK